MAANTQVTGGYAQLSLEADPVHTYTWPLLNSTATVKYGYFEAQIQTAHVLADSAFFLSNFGPQPNGDPWTEIDALEQMGTNSPTTATFNAHYEEPDGSGGYIDHDSPGSWAGLSDLTANYHVYGLDWRADKITYYVDGVKRRQIANTYWDVPLHVLFDVEDHTDWLGTPQPGNLPATMSVDYVRVWAVPEPSSIVLLVSVMFSLLAYGWRRRREVGRFAGPNTMLQHNALPSVRCGMCGLRGCYAEA